MVNILRLQDAGGGEPVPAGKRLHLLHAATPGPCGDPIEQLPGVPVPQPIRRIAIRFIQVHPLHRLAKTAKLRLAERRERHPSVEAVEKVRGADRQVPVPRPFPVFPRLERVEPGPVEQPDDVLHLEIIDELPLARPFPVVQGGQDRVRAHEAGDPIGDPDSRLDRSPVLEARDRSQSAHALGHGVVRCSPRPRPPASAAGNVQLDDVRIHFPEGAVVQSPFRHSPRRQVVDDHVRSLHKLQEQRLGLGVPYVHPHPVLIVILDLQPRRHPLPEVRIGGHVPHLIPLPPLELDHLRAEFRQVITGGGPENDGADLQYPHPFQRFRLVEEPFLVEQPAGGILPRRPPRHVRTASTRRCATPRGGSSPKRSWAAHSRTRYPWGIYTGP